MFYAKIFAKMF